MLDIWLPYKLYRNKDRHTHSRKGRTNVDSAKQAHRKCCQHLSAIILAGRNIGKSQMDKKWSRSTCRQEDDLPWFLPGNKLTKPGEVEVLLVQDSWPTNEYSIWMMKLLKVAVKITYSTIWKSRGQNRRKPYFSVSWESLYQYNVPHDNIGEMTDGRFCVVVCTKIGWLLRRVRASQVSAMLGKALSNTKYGRQATAVSHMCQPNLYQRILQWKNRVCNVILSSVFHQDTTVERKITSKEMCWIFDYPTNCTGIRIDQDVEILTYTNTLSYLRARKWVNDKDRCNQSRKEKKGGIRS